MFVEAVNGLFVCPFCGRLVVTFGRDYVKCSCGSEWVKESKVDLLLTRERHPEWF